MSWLAAVLFLILLQIAVILVLEYRRPAIFTAWTAIVLAVPFAGLILYVLIAQEYRTRRVIRDWRRARGPFLWPEQEKGRPAVRLEESVREDSAFSRLYRLADQLPFSRTTLRNEVEVYADTAPLFEAMLHAMEQAEDHIHAEFFIIRDDEIGNRFKQLWIRKAKEGVSVRILYDGVGCSRLKRAYLDELRRAGVEIKCFLPPLVALFDRQINYRNHRKCVIVDGKVGFLGGANIGDEYLGKNPRLGYWRDTCVKIVGDAVYDLQRIFAADWEFVSGKRLDSPMLFPEHRASGTQRVQVIASGPDSRYDPVLEVYFTMISLTQRRLWMETPYFIPDPALYMALKTAAVSGVDVRVIIPGVPDKRFVYYASLSYLEELMAAGVKVYRFHKGFVHAKVIIADDAAASVGSANVDMRSFYTNFELNVLVYDRNVIARLEADFLADLKDCTEIRLEAFKRRPRLQKWLEGAARLMSPLL